MINTIATILVSGLITTNPSNGNANLTQIVEHSRPIRNDQPIPKKEETGNFQTYFIKEEELCCPEPVQFYKKNQNGEPDITYSSAEQNRTYIRTRSK
jgi:hypothetical protein